ncbi:amidase [Christiangramia fulva]|uniref:Amidase n=1 Tax=Christiangramia fulva TaxID=2126553 RepID=A0A2R3ZBD3_9FLAO|nr:amidase [Christiangramia fulva]
MRSFSLQETNFKSVREMKFDMALLPWGATEAHNYHLPYGTDNFLAEEVAIKAAEKAWDNNIHSIVLPTMSYGVNTGQMKVPLCMNMNPSTQLAFLSDIIQVLKKDGIDKLVIINAHGGNNFKQIIRELSMMHPEVFTCAINWWQIEKATEYFSEPGDHAGELETAAMMYLKPDLVLPLNQAGLGKEKKSKLRGIREGWVVSQREWSKVTEDTGVGNPRKATEENGKKFFQDSVKKIAGFLKELQKCSIDNLYET